MYIKVTVCKDKKEKVSSWNYQVHKLPLLNILLGKSKHIYIVVSKRSFFEFDLISSWFIVTVAHFPAQRRSSSQNEFGDDRSNNEPAWGPQLGAPRLGQRGPLSGADPVHVWIWRFCCVLLFAVFSRLINDNRGLTLSFHFNARPFLCSCFQAANLNNLNRCWCLPKMDMDWFTGQPRTRDTWTGDSVGPLPDFISCCCLCSLICK